MERLFFIIQSDKTKEVSHSSPPPFILVQLIQLFHSIHHDSVNILIGKLDTLVVTRLVTKFLPLLHLLLGELYHSYLCCIL